MLKRFFEQEPVGMVASAAGFGASCVTALEVSLRILSLLIGITIGLLTIRAQLRK